MGSVSLPRITARVDVDTQDLLSKAAALSGLTSINAFVLNSAIEKARQIVEKEEQMQLTKQDAMRLVEVLEKPAQSNPKLQSAFARYETSAS